MTEENIQSIAISAASVIQANDEQGTSEDQANADVISARSTTGLLDLPTEIRLMIFRHLFFYPLGLSFGYWEWLDPRARPSGA